MSAKCRNQTFAGHKFRATLLTTMEKSDGAEMPERWPDIPYEAWKNSCATVHLWTQIVGKYRLARTPWVNHSWHATFYVTSRGLTTSPIPAGDRNAQFDFDFVGHQLIGTLDDGAEEVLPLQPMTVADFYERFLALTDKLGVRAKFHGSPNEVTDPIPFEQDTAHDSYDANAVHRYWCALMKVDRVLKDFRTSFIGKVSPVHLFWGSFDLAVTRFSGRAAPVHPGGIPALPDAVTREAYSHEVSSAGFWPGGGPVDYPAFYSYAYPAPDGFSTEKVTPGEAFFDEQAGEFILPYDAVRNSSDPKSALLAFLESTYEAAARLASWDRASLDCPRGRISMPRPI
jgi:hypothetical protein